MSGFMAGVTGAELGFGQAEIPSVRSHHGLIDRECEHRSAAKACPLMAATVGRGSRAFARAVRGPWRAFSRPFGLLRHVVEIGPVREELASPGQNGRPGPVGVVNPVKGRLELVEQVRV